MDNSLGSVEICLNLADYTDDEVCADIKKLLKRWRKQTGIEEPKIKKQRNGDTYNVVNYKIIPLINLATWEAINNQRILERSLEEVVFKGMNIGKNDIQTKFKAFMYKILDDNIYRRNID